MNNHRRCDEPIEVGELVAYLLGELPAERADRIEEHYFTCPSCTKRLELVRALGDGVKELVQRGHASVAVTDALVNRAAEQGVVLRTYRLQPGEKVACTAAPTDDFVVLRLGLRVDPSETVDVSADVIDVEQERTETRLTENITIDRASGEIVYLYAGELVRSLPRTRWTMHAHVRGPQGVRTVGPYVLDHTPWEQLGRGT